MKAIINGKRYDTQTAECVHCWENGYSRSDFQFRAKTLYKTKNGSWFLHHDGGAMTDMAKSYGNNSVGGSESIEVISAEEAFRFLTSHGGEEEAEVYFADRIKDA